MRTETPLPTYPRHGDVVRLETGATIVERVAGYNWPLHRAEPDHFRVETPTGREIDVFLETDENDVRVWTVERRIR